MLTKNIAQSGLGVVAKIIMKKTPIIFSENYYNYSLSIIILSLHTYYHHTSIVHVGTVILIDIANDVATDAGILNEIKENFGICYADTIGCRLHHKLSIGDIRLWLSRQS